MSLQVSWQGVISQVIHCRSQQVRAGAEGYHKSVHIVPVTAGLMESHGPSRESWDVTLLPMVPLGPSMGRVGPVRGFQGSPCWSQYRPDAKCPVAPPLTGRQARSVHSAFLAISPNLFMERNAFSAGSQRGHGLHCSSGMPSQRNKQRCE